MTPQKNSVLAAGLALGLLLLCANPTSAAPAPKSSYANAWNSLYFPSQSMSLVQTGTTKTCQLCHEKSNGGDSWNAYGWRIKQFMDGGSSINVALMQSEPFDSDADPTGSTNLQEINASSQPGWTPGNNNTIFFDDGSQTTGQAPPAAILGNLDPVVVGDIDVSPLSIEYPMVEVGGASSKKVTISNTGPGAIQVTGLTLTGGSYAAGAGWPSVPFNVSMGSPVELPVRYLPTATGAAMGNLNIASNDPDESSVDVSLAGNSYQGYGCGTNPANSLVYLSGEASIGSTFTLGVDNPTGAQPGGSFAVLALATTPDPGFPCGTPLPGFGMGGGLGELLVSLVPPDPVIALGPTVWAGPGSPAALSTTIPPNPNYVGTALFYQGAIIDPVGPVGIGLSEGLTVVIAP